MRTPARLSWTLLSTLALTLSACSSKGPTTGSSTGVGGNTSGGTGGGTGYATGSSGGTGNTTQTCPQCLGLGLICNPAAATGCGPCAADRDCAAAGAAFGHCQVQNPDSGTFGTCVQCTASAACPDGGVCDLAGVDDPMGLASARTPNLCYPDCRSASGGCAAGSICDLGSGLCLFGCTQSPNSCAAATQVCDADAGVCVGCLSPGDCPIDEAGCLAEQCGNCAHDAECPNGQSCDIQNQLCNCGDSSQCGPLAPDCVVPSGFKNADSGHPELRCGCQPDAGTCAQGTVCNPTAGPTRGGECLPSCIDGGSDCSLSGAYCDIVSGLCGPCTSDVACAGNQQGFICLTDGGAGGSCSCRVGAAGSCPRGMVCNPPLGCTPSCLQADAGCAPPEICDQATGACRGCLQTADCAKSSLGLRCDNGDGGGFTCVCESPADCLNPDAGCSSTVHQCGLCAQPTDCPQSNPGCNTQSFTCGSCALDADCPTALAHCTDAGTCGR